MAHIKIEDANVSYFLLEGAGRNRTTNIGQRLLAGDEKAAKKADADSDAKRRIGAHLVKRGWFTEVKALEGITLNLKAGDRVGLIGTNGSGKSTLLRLCSGGISAQSGRVEVEGKVCPQLSMTAGTRAPLTGRSNAELKCLYLGISMRQIPEYVERVRELSGLGEFFDMPVNTYSAGMRSRLAMSLVSLIKGDIVLLDEWVRMADATVSKVASRLQEQVIGASQIIIAASHSEAVLREWTDSIIWLHRGQIVRQGPINQVLRGYNKFVASGETTPHQLLRKEK